MRDHGWSVLSLTSRLGAGEQPDAVTYSLEGGISSDALRGVDALIHCAYDFRPVTWEDIRRVNVAGTARLYDAARQAGVVRIVCISTISAYDGCRSLYGKAKLAIEEHTRQAGGVAVRPGLVYGRNAGGMLGALDRVMASSKVVPLLGPGQWTMYFSHEQDLCALVRSLCENESAAISRPITAAATRGMSFKGMLSELARAHGNRPLFVPVPWRIVWLLLRMLEIAGIRPGFRSDSVLGLAYPNPAPSFVELGELGMSFRDFKAELLR